MDARDRTRIERALAAATKVRHWASQTNEEFLAGIAKAMEAEKS